MRDEKSTIYMSESPPPTALPARVLALKSKEISDRRKSLPAQSSQTQSPLKRRQSESTSHTSTRPMRKPRQASTITVPSEGEVSDSDSDTLSDPPSESDSEMEATPHAASSASSTGLGLSATTPGVRPEASRLSGRPPPRKRPSPPRTTTRVRLSVAAPPPPLTEPAKTQHVRLSSQITRSFADGIRHHCPQARNG
jgi:hypothetical protein